MSIWRDFLDLITGRPTAQIRTRAVVADSVEGGYAQCPACDHRLSAAPGQRVRIQHNDDGSHTWISLPRDGLSC